MKLLPHHFLLPLLAITAGAADGGTAPLSANPAANATNWFVISGMHCDGCAKGLTSELTRVPGVVNASVTFSNKLAVVAYDTNRVTLHSLRTVVMDAGYEAKPIKPPKSARP